MATPQEVRAIRLSNDYKEMLRLRGSIIVWKAVRGTPPIVEEYEVTINVRTIFGIDLSRRPSYRSSSVVRLSLPNEYPAVAPHIGMITIPPPFHPNWFTNGSWCYGTWNPAESLGNFISRMIKTLQFDPLITNPDSPANREATTWYLENKNSGFFPCDRQVLPDPTSAFSSFGGGTFIVKKK
jgi:ubiquitin-protein ligase